MSKIISNMVFPSIIYLAVSMFFIACSKDNDALSEGNGINISGVSIPSTNNVYPHASVTFTGKGYAVGDKIRFVAITNESKVYEANVTSVTEQSATFILPNDFSTGKYRIILIRGEKTVSLGSASFDVGMNLNIPDIAGMTVKGVVYCNGIALPGVMVSDGYEVTTTDVNGIYYLASEKKNKYVFISVPGNYEVSNDINAPQFYQRLNGGQVVEQRNFSLMQVDNNRHLVIALADMHLANRTTDLSQFSKFLLDVNATVAAYEATGVKVYGLTLGDQTWDQYWYTNKFSFPEYLTYMHQIACPVFNCMGNHDNDPYQPGDWVAEQAFRTYLGPNYYSFNLGKVHYIVLDNVEYVNTGGAQGTLGDCSFNSRVIADQIAWLKKDLAIITDKSTPIVVGMHVQLYGRPSVSNSATPSMSNAQEFVNCFSAFSNVNVLTGHLHENYTVEPSASLMEHNTGAVCATWWWTGNTNYAGNHICKDGSVGGYSVWEANNSNLEWYYKGLGYNKDYQFRSYDLNTIHITADKYAVSANVTYAAKLSGFAGSYANVNSANEVLINVFNYDSKWKIEVLEGEKSLQVTRVSVKDPLHIISYEAKRLNVNADPTSSFVTSTQSHMFKVTASTSNSTLNIKVTDRFGHEYTETMNRPKSFVYTMK